MSAQIRHPALVRAAVAVLAGSLAMGVSACAPTGSTSERVTPESAPVYPQLATYPDIPVIENIPYGNVDGQPLLLDACFPGDSTIDDAGDEPRATIVSIHGGSWTRGDKANLNWRSVCQWFASEGFVAVSVNYRLAPAHSFPAQLDDVQQAVRWLRDPAQVKRYNLDPARIGAFGGSAGGNLAALLGTAGQGGWTDGSRVAAVAELSGPADLREPIATTGGSDPDFSVVQLGYLGCTDFGDCPQAAKASPVLQVDATDPPFFVAHSIGEFLPLRQSEALVETLRGAGVDTTFVTLEGSLHSIGMLDDDMKARLLDFFRGTLTVNVEVTDAKSDQPSGN